MGEEIYHYTQNLRGPTVCGISERELRDYALTWNSIHIARFILEKYRAVKIIMNNKDTEQVEVLPTDTPPRSGEPLECTNCGTRAAAWGLIPADAKPGDQCPCCFLDDYDCDGTLCEPSTPPTTEPELAQCSQTAKSARGGYPIRCHLALGHGGDCEMVPDRAQEDTTTEPRSPEEIAREVCEHARAVEVWVPGSEAAVRWCPCCGGMCVRMATSGPWGNWQLPEGLAPADRDGCALRSPEEVAGLLPCEYCGEREGAHGDAFICMPGGETRQTHYAASRNAIAAAIRADRASDARVREAVEQERERVRVVLDEKYEARKDFEREARADGNHDLAVDMAMQASGIMLAIRTLARIERKDKC